MAIRSVPELFNRLLPATTSKEMREILNDLGDYHDVGLDNPFGELKLMWHAYGENTSNYSTIGVASKPGRSLTERITNAIDAVLEDHSMKVANKPSSPQAAVNAWFGRPFSTSDSGLFSWDYSVGSYDKKVGVILNASENDEAPTIDVVDNGLGIRPEKFSSTILSLHGGNKMTKKFLIGAFGQGGSSTLAFCDYVFVLSRHFEDPNTVSFTVIREVYLGEDYKENCYAYLVLQNEKGEVTVPSFVFKDPIELYPGVEKLRINQLNKGTLVRHFSFRLTNLSKNLGPAEGNLYHYLHCSMFDPLIPFQIIDMRNKSQVDQEIVGGSRNRLMQKKAKAEDELDKTNSQLRLYRPISYITPFGTTEPCIKVEYWVVLNKRKTENKKTGEITYTLRGESNALFIQKRHPAVVTMNGQNQGELTATQLMKDLGLDNVAKHLVVNIDATGAPSAVKRLLFSTNRETLKDGDVLESIKQELRRMMAEDLELKAIENELVEQEIKSVAEKTDDEVKNQIVKLLREAGFTPSAEGNVAREGTGDDSLDPDKKRRKRERETVDPPEPLPTLLYPNVTRFEIVSPKPKMKIHLGGTSMVRVETDADFRYEKEIRIKFDPNTVEISSYFPLLGGRTRWRVRTSPTANIGDFGKISVSLTKPDGDQLKDEIEFEVIPPAEKPSKEERGFIPDFEVLPVSPEEEEKWKKLWPNVPGNSEEAKALAYKAIKLGTKTIVFYSTIFGPYFAMCSKLQVENSLAYKFFETNYKVWIGYHAILQLNSQTTDSPDSDEELAKFEGEQEKERSRVAQMQIKQALESSKLMVTLSKQKATVSD